MHDKWTPGRLFVFVVGFVVTASLSVVSDDVLFINLSLTDGTVLCSVDEPSKIVSLTESSVAVVVSSSDSCASAAAKCAWICSRDIQCTSFNYDATSANCKLFYYVPLNYSSANDCAHFRMNVVPDVCPVVSDVLPIGSSPPVVNMISPQCCSLPFTYNGLLYAQCAQNVSNSADVGCFVANRTWVSCLPPTGFVVRYSIQNITVSNFIGQFPTITINNWIIIQQRLNASDWLKCSWLEYKQGFGVVEENFWFGLEKVYQMTNAGSYRLRFEVESVNGTWFSSEYDVFHIDSESANYTIHVDGYSGDGGDALNFRGLSGGKMIQLQNGMGFTTYDADHDQTVNNCGASVNGYAGFWHNACYYICLTCSASSGKFNWKIRAANGTVNIYPLRTSRIMMKLAT